MANCSIGEFQEVCVPTGSCDWNGLPCYSQLRGYACPEPRLGLAGSALEPLLQDARDRVLIAAAAMALLCCSAPALLALARRRGQPAAGTWRHRLRALMSNRRWLESCAASTMLLAAFAALSPPDVWGGCEQDVCVYHLMFCEYTRHGAAVRHPSNFWSNLPFLYNALFIITQKIEDINTTGNVPYRGLDAIFALVALAHSLASFAWHGSNCTSVHFVDIGLMNAVIMFFPLRFSAMSVASFMKHGDRIVSWPAAVLYAAMVVHLLRTALLQGPNFHQGFPTGRARSDLTSSEVASLLVFPALYPCPAWIVVALRKRWDQVWALLIATLMLSIGFGAQMMERWAMDLVCYPGSLVQPTAVLHAATGLTIAAAYAQAVCLHGLPVDEDGSAAPKCD